MIIHIYIYQVLSYIYIYQLLSYIYIHLKFYIPPGHPYLYHLYPSALPIFAVCPRFMPFWGHTGSLSSPFNWRLLVLVSSAFLVLWIWHVLAAVLRVLRWPRFLTVCCSQQETVLFFWKGKHVLSCLFLVWERWYFGGTMHIRWRRIINRQVSTQRR